MDDLEINNDNKSFKERIDFINNFIENSNVLEDKFNLQKYLNKFRSRYNGKITIQGDRPDNYKLNAKLNGYLDVSKEEYKNNSIETVKKVTGVIESSLNSLTNYIETDEIEDIVEGLELIYKMELMTELGMELDDKNDDFITFVKELSEINNKCSSDKEKLIKLLEEYNQDSKQYLEEYLKNDEEAQQYFPTIDEYDDCVAQLDNMFEIRIYDLAIYNITNNLLNELKK